MTETEAESQQDFQLGRGAVLYNDRRDSRDGRDL